MEKEFVVLYQELARVDPQNPLVETYKFAFKRIVAKNEKKCEDCGGTGLVALADGVRGLKSCPRCR